MPSKDLNNDDLAREFHWAMDILQNIDAGLVVVDMEFNVQLWNRFMQNHSAISSNEILGQNIFKLFPELPETWLKRKIQSITTLRNSAFTTWEQHPYLFRFDNYRPISGNAEFMYQNSTIIPMISTTDEVNYICLLIYDVTEVATNRQSLQQANKQLYILSRTDGLTGLVNRKYWEEALNHEFQRYLRYNHPCTLIMFDIDHFKRINDTYGHPAGDEVIRQTAEVLKKNTRDIDIAGRYGGEEFAIILVGTGSAQALALAERIRMQMEETTIYYEDHVINYTISLGLAELNSTMTDPTMWIDASDRGLYRAKRAGRNQSVVYTS